MEKGISERLKEAAELFEAGRLTQGEFQTLKKTILSEASERRPASPPREVAPQIPVYGNEDRQSLVFVDTTEAKKAVSKGNWIGCLFPLLLAAGLAIRILGKMWMELN
jgi:hypothetical protein